MGLGAAVGVLVTLAIFAHAGLLGVPWLVNVALAKLGFIAAAGLMAGGAATVRISARRERRQLASRPPG
jgi:hypothetical protein